MHSSVECTPQLWWDDVTIWVVEFQDSDVTEGDLSLMRQRGAAKLCGDNIIENFKNAL